MTHNTNRICKACGITFEVIGKTPKSIRKIKRPTCSDKCRLEVLVKSRRPCRGGCLDENLLYREVTFKNKTTHVQEYCKRCLKTKFVSKHISLLLEKPLPEDNLDWLK